MRHQRLGLRGGVAAAAVASILLVGCASDVDDNGAGVAVTGRMTQMETSGEMHDMLEQHRQMLERMQDDASPAMLELMNDDSMWQMMRTEEWARLDEEHQRDMSRGTEEGTIPASGGGRITQMEASGEMHDMAERHRQMLERMQQNASPAMQTLMNDDPMWQMMRSGEWARLDEEHQEDIDRMLGRGQP